MATKWFWIVLVIVLLALGLRVYNLSRESLWTDEAFTVHHAQLTDWQQFIQHISTTEAASPGHYLFLHYWIQWFGNSEFSVRLPSVIFGTLSVILLFFIVLRLFTMKVAVLSSLFMATSMLQVQFSQEARLYSLFTFLVLLSAYFFLKILLERQKAVPFLGYTLTVTSALLVNYLALVVLAFYSVILSWYALKKKISISLWKRWVVAHLLLLLAAGLLLWPVLQAQFFTLNTGLREALLSKNLPSPFASLGLFFYALPVLLLVLILLFILGYKTYLVQVLTSSSFDALFSFFILIIGSIYLYFSFVPVTFFTLPLTRFPITHSYFLIRHSFFLAPVWYVFLAWKISSLRWRKVAVIAALLVLAVSMTALYEYYSTPTKPQWRETIQFIAGQSAEQGGGSPLILLDKSGMSNEFLLNYYYPGEYRLLKLTFSEQPRRFAQLSEEEVLAQLPGEQEFWLMLARNARTGTYYRDLLDRYYQRDVSREFYQIQVYHYKKI